jgi:phenylacetate-coenzyme A ligase PaaK-like adenylate-forming protein
VTAAADAAAFRARFQARLLAGLPEQLERLGWGAERIRSDQRDRLRALLAAAIAGSPFHARRLCGVDPATFDLGDLAALPVMTKAELMDEFDDVVTDRRLSRDRCEAALAREIDAPRIVAGEFL